MSFQLSKTVLYSQLAKNDFSYQLQLQLQPQTLLQHENVSINTSIQSNYCYNSSQPKQFFSGPSRTYDDVGFSPGKSPPATVIKRKEKKIPPLITNKQQRCFSSLHVHDSNYNPDNSTTTTFAFNNNDIKDKNRFMPYIIPTTTARKQALLEIATTTANEASLFGPIPTMDSFVTAADAFNNKPCSLNDDDDDAFVTPPMETKNADNDDDDDLILDDEMVFQELELLSNAINSTTSDLNTTLPPSPPLSPFDFSFDQEAINDSLLEEQSSNDFILFP